jgi:3-phenylpropionate/trans-cinnamate dioxygenase ferredoxin subunit
MARHVVGRVSDLPEGGRLLIELQGHKVGIFHVRGRYYALLNRCPHMGAELCRGSILGHLEAAGPGEFNYDASRSLVRCPWHGWEYDLATGQSYFDSRVKPYPVDVLDGGEVQTQVDAGEAGFAEAADRAEKATGLPAARLAPGPYVAETYPITIEDDYLVVTLPGRGARTAALAAE